jgi:hypothetical protein
VEALIQIARAPSHALPSSLSDNEWGVDQDVYTAVNDDLYSRRSYFFLAGI